MTERIPLPTPAELRAIPAPTERFRAARDTEPLMKRVLADIAREAANEM